MDDEEPLNEVEPVETEGERQVRSLVQGLVVALLGVGVGLAVPGAGGAVAAAATGSLLPAWEIVRRQVQSRTEDVVGHGVTSAGMTPEGFASWVEADPRHGALLLTIVSAAARSTAEAHLDALAGVLADGMHDDARIDVGTRAARALGELGPPEVRVLQLYEDRDHDRDERHGARLHIGDLLEQLPPLAEAMDALQASLVRLGCITQDSGGMLGGGVASHRISGFGKTCLAFLVNRAGPADRRSRPG